MKAAFVTHKMLFLSGGGDFVTEEVYKLQKFEINVLKGKFSMEPLQSHIGLKAYSYMVKYLRISSYSTLNFLIYKENFIFFLLVQEFTST
jgi:hypothetical protein